MAILIDAARPSFYVAASSAEIDRAEKWIKALRDRHIQVTSTWPKTIRRVQAERKIATVGEASNPREATRADRRVWSMENVNAIRSAHWFWLLIPNAETPSQGAYFEFGLAWGNKPCIASGGDQRFVFSSLAGELFETDDQAFEAISAISSAGP